MAVEAFIFDGHQSVAHHVGDVLAAYDRTVLDAVQIGEQGAVGRVDLSGLGQGDLALGLQRGQVLFHGCHRA